MNRSTTRCVEVLVVVHDKRVFRVIEARAADDAVLSCDAADALRGCLMINDPRRHERPEATYNALPLWPVPNGVHVLTGLLNCDYVSDPVDGSLDASYDFEMRGHRELTQREFLIASANHVIMRQSVVLTAL